jgi:hypothetical protein
VKDERGQTAVLITLTMVAMTAMSAMGIETGHIYYAYRLLQASTNSATLAAANAMPVIGTKTMSCAPTSDGPVNSSWCNLYTYSSATADSVTGLNTTGMLTNATVNANFYCSGTMSSAPFNVGCTVPPTGGGSCTSATCNAIQVTQTAQVNLWFGGLLGLRTMNLTATASASMRGGNHVPYNIALIIDTTGSMGSTDAPTSDGCTGGDKQIQCAISGAESMLESMWPCVGTNGTSCQKGDQYADAVALYVFPAIKSGNTSDDTSCPTSNPPTVPYGFEDLNPKDTWYSFGLPSSSGTFSHFAPTDAGTYQVLSFEDTYKTSNAPGPLSGTDGLAIAVGGGSGRNCKGLQAPGGQDTYYAQVIYQAQADLLAQQNSEVTSFGEHTQNVMIILSDGDSTACSVQAVIANGGLNASSPQGCDHSDIVAWNNANNTSCSATNLCLNGVGTATTNPIGTLSNGFQYGYNSTAYPSELGQCGQAVQAAQSATKAGTLVYTIAMGAPTSGGCTTDSHFTASAGSTYGAIAWPSGTYSKQPCNAIEAMASDVSKFFSDDTGGCPADTTNKTYKTIGGIFTAVTNSLTTSRLIPNGT